MFDSIRECTPLRYSIAVRETAAVKMQNETASPVLYEKTSLERAHGSLTHGRLVSVSTCKARIDEGICTHKNQTRRLLRLATAGLCRLINTVPQPREAPIKARLAMPWKILAELNRNCALCTRILRGHETQLHCTHLPFCVLANWRHSASSQNGTSKSAWR